MEIALIDTSIIIEPFTDYEKDKKSYKKASLTLLRYSKRKFVPAISISILGELEFIINSKESLKKELNKRDAMKEIINNFVNDCKIIKLDKETIHLAHKILNNDPFLDPLDVLHFSSAIISKCNSFIFMDDKLENSQIINRIAKEHNLELKSFNIQINEDKGRPRGEFIWE